MKKIIFFSFIVSLFILSACNTETLTNDTNTDSTTIVNKQTYPSTGVFYATNDSSLIVANPIIYDVIVINNDPADDWADFCLANTDVEAISNIIYNAVYQEKLIPYHYSNDTIINLRDIKNLEQENKVSTLGKLQFEEEWYFDEVSLTMSKKVLSITIGYQLVNDLGEAYGFKPGFKVYLDNTHNTISR